MRTICIEGSLKLKIKQLIQNTPNDQELGAKIRELAYKTELINPFNKEAYNKLNLLQNFLETNLLEINRFKIINGVISKRKRKLVLIDSDDLGLASYTVKEKNSKGQIIESYDFNKLNKLASSLMANKSGAV
mgnify:CR=1 FL=1